jgi:hypothetical protein
MYKALIEANYYKAIDQTTLNTVQLYEQYATISYCAANTAGRIGAKVTCPGGTCPLIEGNDVTIIANLDTWVVIVHSYTGSMPNSSCNIFPYDTGYVIALDRINETVVVSFRGSRGAINIINALSSAIFPSRSTSLCVGCAVAVSFFNPWQQVSQQIFAQVQNTLNQNSGFRVVTTGHSLGGALLHVAGLDFRVNTNWTVDVVSGQLRDFEHIQD